MHVCYVSDLVQMPLESSQDWKGIRCQADYTVCCIAQQWLRRRQSNIHRSAYLKHVISQASIDPWASTKLTDKPLTTSEW